MGLRYVCIYMSIYFCKPQHIPAAFKSRQACNRCLAICALWCQTTASWQPSCQRHGGRPGFWDANQAITAIPTRPKSNCSDLNSTDNTFDLLLPISASNKKCLPRAAVSDNSELTNNLQCANYIMG